ARPLEESDVLRVIDHTTSVGIFPVDPCRNAERGGSGPRDPGSGVQAQPSAAQGSTTMGDIRTAPLFPGPPCRTRAAAAGRGGATPWRSPCARARYGPDSPAG